MLRCKFCQKECKSERSIIAHECVCPSNENRRLFSRKWSEEKKLAWSIKCRETKCNNTGRTESRKEKYSIRKIEFNKLYWTEERKILHSNKMQEVVRNNPDSYSKNNVSGRVKVYEVDSSAGITKVKGKWELSVAKFLNINKIKWTNNITPFSYFWKEKWHLYFPDFYLIDSDKFIEVKGYRTDRDLEKWKSVNKELIIIDKSNIDNLEEILRG